MYRRFNPLEKEFDGLHSSQIVINIVSGQYVHQSNLLASTYVEVEMIGIPVDCSKKKTHVVKRNALNPIWNDTFFFKVMFHDLAFLRFSVIDNDTNHMVSQRVIPLKCLRPGKALSYYQVFAYFILKTSIQFSFFFFLIDSQGIGTYVFVRQIIDH